MIVTKGKKGWDFFGDYSTELPVKEKTEEKPTEVIATQKPVEAIAAQPSEATETKPAPSQ